MAFCPPAHSILSLLLPFVCVCAVPVKTAAPLSSCFVPLSLIRVGPETKLLEHLVSGAICPSLTLVEKCVFFGIYLPNVAFLPIHQR